MNDYVVTEAIHELTDIVTAQAEIIRDLQRRVTYLEKYAKKRRLTVIDAFADSFSNALGSMR